MALIVVNRPGRGSDCSAERHAGTDQSGSAGDFGRLGASSDRNELSPPAHQECARLVPRGAPMMVGDDKRREVRAARPHVQPAVHRDAPASRCYVQFPGTKTMSTQ
jgi:hypothetical protein